MITEFKQRIGNLKLIPAGGGCFEVSLDGELVYSKLRTGQFPDAKAIAQEIRNRLTK